MSTVNFGPATQATALSASPCSGALHGDWTCWGETHHVGEECGVLGSIATASSRAAPERIAHRRATGRRTTTSGRGEWGSVGGVAIGHGTGLSWLRESARSSSVWSSRCANPKDGLDTSLGTQTRPALTDDRRHLRRHTRGLSLGRHGIYPLLCTLLCYGYCVACAVVARHRQRALSLVTASGRVACTYPAHARDECVATNIFDHCLLLEGSKFGLVLVLCLLPPRLGPVSEDVAVKCHHRARAPFHASNNLEA